MKPRFAVDAHLAALFAQEVDEHEEAKEEAIQHGNGGEQAVADGRLDSPAACLPSTTPEGVDELVEPSPPRQLPTVLDEALQEELTTLNSERHDWIERLGEPDRSLIRGKYRRMADFWVSTTDPDATMMNSKGGRTASIAFRMYRPVQAISSQGQRVQCVSAQISVYDQQNKTSTQSPCGRRSV